MIWRKKSKSSSKCFYPTGNETPSIVMACRIRETIVNCFKKANINSSDQQTAETDADYSFKFLVEELDHLREIDHKGPFAMISFWLKPVPNRFIELVIIQHAKIYGFESDCWRLTFAVHMWGYIQSRYVRGLLAFFQLRHFSHQETEMLVEETGSCFKLWWQKSFVGFTWFCHIKVVSASENAVGKRNMPAFFSGEIHILRLTSLRSLISPRSF